MKGQFYAFTKAILALACLMPGTLVAQAAKVTPLFSKDLTNLPGKEGLMVLEYPPASSYPIHRHNAHRFIYVLEGSIVMQHARERSFRDFFRLPPTKESQPVGGPGAWRMMTNSWVKAQSALEPLGLHIDTGCRGGVD